MGKWGEKSLKPSLETRISKKKNYKTLQVQEKGNPRRKDSFIVENLTISKEDLK